LRQQNRQTFAQVGPHKGVSQTINCLSTAFLIRVANDLKIVC
jgi:hypothetical protein